MLSGGLLFSCAASATAQPFSDADSCTFYLQKAKESKEARKNWEAEKFFQKASGFGPENEAVKLEFANYYCEQRKYSLASKLYVSLLEKDPNHAIAIKKLIDISFLLRKWEDVTAYADKATKNNIKVDKMHYMVGKSYYEQENYGQAKNSLLLQVAQTPADKETITLLGKVYVELNKYNEAIDIYLKCLATSPENAELTYELGLLYSAQRKDKEAVKYFELAASKGLKQDLAYLQNLGSSYLEFDIKKGVEVLNKVMEKKPDDPEIMTQIAQAYYRVENFGTAFDYYYKIYLNDNKNSKALYMSGVSMIRKGDKQKGAYICDQAIAMDPELAQLKSSKSML